MKRISLALIILLVIAKSQLALAQGDSTQLTPQQEVWPELDIYYHFNDNFRLYSVVSGTKYDQSSYSEGAFSLFLDYFGFKAPISRLYFVNREERFRFRLRIGYLYSTTPPTDEDQIKSSTFRIQTSNTFSLSAKMRAYYIGRLDVVFSDDGVNARYVPRLRLERDFKTEYLTFSGYTFAERYLDFQGKDLDRTRITLGAILKVSKNVDFETYYLYQFSNPDNVPAVKAIGAKLKLYFYSHEKKTTETSSAPH
ncbi:DUF2490 domain-containing protein [Algoriphagus sp.]|uniref:DUF2490 domain-containing protein n=1 Tax=Algoriphagus sp. TaxID=1872435 RepID=UPI0032949280